MTLRVSRPATWTFLLCATLVGASIAACDEKKTDAAPPATSATTTAAATTSTTTMAMSASATASAGEPTAALASAAAIPSAALTAVATAGASVKAAATGAPTATATATTAAAVASSAAPVASAAPGSCGGKDQPKCPLQGWMGANMQPAMAAADPVKLAAALRASAKFAPPGYANWAKYATDGAAAVEAAKDVSAGKPACKSCHGEYQKRYRTEMRERPI